MTYKLGDKVAALDDYEDPYGCIEKHKVYTVVTQHKNLLFFIDENGNGNWVLAKHFEPAHIREFNSKLKDLCK